MRAMFPVWMFLAACKPFVPAEGAYVLADATLVNDSCGLMTDEFDPDQANGDTLTLSLTASPHDWAAVLGADDGQPFACTLTQSAQELDCEPVVIEDGDLTTTLTLFLDFDSPTSFSMTYDMLLECEGDSCADIGFDPPCTVQITATGATDAAES